MIIRVTLVVKGEEYACEGEFDDRAGLMMMGRSLLVSAESTFKDLMRKPERDIPDTGPK